MQPLDLVSPPRRMARTLHATYQGPLGLGHGECWWLGIDAFSLLAEERIPRRSALDVRIDAGPGLGDVRLHGVVDALAQGRHARGYLHAARVRAVSGDTLARLEAILRMVNPAAAPRRFGDVDPDAESIRRRLPGLATGALDARVATTVEPPAVHFHRGPPATVLVSLDSPAKLALHARLDPARPRIVVPALPGPLLGEVVLAVIETPHRIFVQCDAVVALADDQTLVLELDRGDRSVLAQLRYEAERYHVDGKWR